MKWTQWDNLIWSFIKTGIEININNLPFNPVAAWNRMTGFIDTIGLIVNGDIGLFDLVKGLGEDLNWVIDHWYIISDKKTYDNGWINEFGSRLAGAYEELVTLGFSTAGIANLANSMTGIKGAGNIKWTGKDFKNIAKNSTPDELINSLESSGWKKTIEAGGSRSGPATILTDPTTGTKVRIHANPSNNAAYFRVQNAGGNYLGSDGLFPSNATKQEIGDLTHFYFGR